MISRMVEDDAFKRLGYDVIQRAVDDVIALKKLGFICDGLTVDRVWPRRDNGQPVRVLGHYTHPHQIDELLLWFNGGGSDDMLRLVGSGVSARTMSDKLEITACNA